MHALPRLLPARLGARLLADHANVKRVFYGMEPGMFADRELLYMSVADLNQLASRIRDNHDLLSRYAADPGLANFFTLINEQANRAMMSHIAGGLLGSASAKPESQLSSRQLDLGFR